MEVEGNGPPPSPGGRKSASASRCATRHRHPPRPAGAHLRNTTSLWKEIQETIAAIAKAKGLNYVVKIESRLKPDSGLMEVLAVAKGSIVYADPRKDLTEEVIRDLNQRFHAGGAKTSKS